MSRLAQRAKS